MAALSISSSPVIQVPVFDFIRACAATSKIVIPKGKELRVCGINPNIVQAVALARSGPKDYEAFYQGINAVFYVANLVVRSVKFETGKGFTPKASCEDWSFSFVCHGEEDCIMKLYPSALRVRLAWLQKFISLFPKGALIPLLPGQPFYLLNLSEEQDAAMQSVIVEDRIKKTEDAEAMRLKKRFIEMLSEKARAKEIHVELFGRVCRAIKDVEKIEGDSETRERELKNALDALKEVGLFKEGEKELIEKSILTCAREAARRLFARKPFTDMLGDSACSFYYSKEDGEEIYNPSIRLITHRVEKALIIDPSEEARINLLKRADSLVVEVPSVKIGSIKPSDLTYTFSLFDVLAKLLSEKRFVLKKGESLKVIGLNLTHFVAIANLNRITELIRDVLQNLNHRLTEEKGLGQARLYLDIKDLSVTIEAHSEAISLAADIEPFFLKMAFLIRNHLTGFFYLALMPDQPLAFDLEDPEKYTGLPILIAAHIEEKPITADMVHSVINKHPDLRMINRRAVISAHEIGTDKKLELTFSWVLESAKASTLHRVYALAPKNCVIVVEFLEGL